MSDWKNLFNSDDFRAYRKKQALAVAELIGKAITRASIGNPKSLEELRGELVAASIFLRLPETLTEDEGLKQNLVQQLQEDIGAITTHLVREAVLGD